MSAKSETDTSFHVTTQDNTIEIEWSLGRSVRNAVQNNLAQHTNEQFALPMVQIGDTLLPTRLMSLRVANHTDIIPLIKRLESVPWYGAITQPTPAIPQPLTGDPRPDLVTITEPQLPSTPITIVREGQIRGARIVVVAFSPIFTREGSIQAVTDLQATIPNATLLQEDAAQLLAHSSPFLADGVPPTNAVAAQNAIKVHVTQPGMQLLTKAALAAVGIDLSAINPDWLHIRLNGAEVALDIRDAEILFYAPTAGDRWNAASVYWLTVEATPGAVRMTSRNVVPASAPIRPIAIDRGKWRAHTLYDSTQPGPAEDHWYTVDLKADPNQKDASKPFHVPLTPTLPLATGSVTLTLEGVAYTQGPHHLTVVIDSSAQTAQWSGTGNWSHTLTFTVNQSTAQLTLVPGTKLSGIQLQRVFWERPVNLDFSGNGAIFSGLSGTWRYQLNNPAGAFRLYDITDPTKPQILTGVTTTFQDGFEPHTYLLTGPQTLHTPILSTHTPVDLATPRNVSVLYIAPAMLHPALESLLNHRRAQGYTAQVIDVQAIYDSWGFGQITPSAIRDFLRYIATAWTPVPLAVTLVGDGTFDPHNYLQKGANNVNLIPPYLAHVDPILGETSCDSCYAQLDGADPVVSKDSLPDILFGRLPVKNVSELERLVIKIIGYETDMTGVGWRGRIAYITDNPDNAGNFPNIADASATLQPQAMAIERVYYDPLSTLPGRIAKAEDAHQRVQQVFNTGTGVVNFVGHGSSFQWAVTDSSKNPAYLLGLYDPDAMNNGKTLPIVLSLSCLTSAFHYAAISGTTVDERLVLHPNGGAIAVWGSSGAGVLYGHNALQRGFYQSLWSERSTVMGGNQPPYLGALTNAGFLELFTNGICCQDAIRTYVLLGDPLTPARVLGNVQRVYVPVTRR